MTETATAPAPVPVNLIKKSELIAALGLTKIQVEKYIRNGMPHVPNHFPAGAASHSSRPANGFDMEAVKAWLSTYRPLSRGKPRRLPAQQELRPPKADSPAQPSTTDYDACSSSEAKIHLLEDDVMATLSMQSCHCSTRPDGFICTRCKGIAAFRKLRKLSPGLPPQEAKTTGSAVNGEKHLLHRIIKLQEQVITLQREKIARCQGGVA